MREAARIVMAIHNMQDATAHDVAAEALSVVWEECEIGCIRIDSEFDFRAAVVDRARSIAKTVAVGNVSRREISLDAPITNDGDADKTFADTWRYRHPATQINDVYLLELTRAIHLLPKKHAAVAALLIEGYNFVDIGIQLNIKPNAAFNRIREARTMLWRNGLIDMATDHGSGS